MPDRRSKKVAERRSGAFWLSLSTAYTSRREQTRHTGSEVGSGSPGHRVTGSPGNGVT